MFKNKLVMALAVSAVLSFPVYAEDEDGWNGEGEFGFTSTSGNSNSQSLSAKLGLGKKHGSWSHNGKIVILQSDDNGIDSADSFVFTEKTEYRFAEKTFAFGRVRYEDDKFSGFQNQAVLSLGMGHVFLDAIQHKIEASAGVGYKNSESDIDVLTDLSDKIQEVVFDGEFKYAFKLSKTSEFNQNLNIEAGDSNTYTKSETFLKLVVVGNLAAKFSYEIKRNSAVPVGTEKTDKVTTVTLVYSF